MVDSANSLPGWTLPILIVIVVRWALLYGRIRWERRVRGVKVFTATSIAFFSGLLLTIYFASVFFRWTEDDFSRNTIALFGLPFLIAGVLGWPPVVVLDDWGITARYLIRPQKQILYSEIRNLCRTSDWGFSIYGWGKTKEISFSTDHLDASEMERELRERASPWYKGEELPMGRLLWESADDDKYSPP